MTAEQIRDAVKLDERTQDEAYLAIAALIERAEADAVKASLTRREMLRRIAQPAPGLTPEAGARSVLDMALTLVEAGMSNFVQTTHGRAHSGGIVGVTTALQRCYSDPTPYHISELAQAVRAFQRGA